VTSGGPVRPEHHALLELDALRERVEQLAAAEDRVPYDSDDVYRLEREVSRAWPGGGAG
jgi:hypothetical protein